MGHLIHWYQDTLAAGGYPLIAALMAMESTVVPVPSEFIIPFAAQRAHAHAGGNLSLWGIALAGTLGSWIGATIMYWVSRWAGWPLVLRYGVYFRMPEAKLHAAERWANRFGRFGVFVARLLPVMRQLIGIPMGIVKMDFRWYSLFTLLGSGIWCSVLVWLGVRADYDDKLLKGEIHHIALWLFGVFVVLGLLYYLVHHFMKEPVKEV
jgi:membrane protein DedA with SNARE-associated domain